MTRILGGLSALFFNYVLAKQIGIQQSGMFFIVLSYIMFASVFCRLGFEQTIVKTISIAYAEKNKKLIGLYFSFYLKFVILSTLSCFFIIILSSNFVATNLFKKPELTDVIYIMSPIIFGVTFTTLLAMTFQSFGKTTLAVVSQNIFHYALAAIALLVVSSTVLETAVYIFSISTIISALSLSIVVFYLYNNIDDKGTSHFLHSKSIWSTSRNNFVIALMQTVMMWIAPLICGFFTSPEDVAQITIAQRISMLVSFILMANNMIVTPKVASYFAAGKRDKMIGLVQNSTKILIFTGCPIILLMFIFSENLLDVFGEDYISATSILRIFIIGQMFNVFTGIVYHVLAMTGHEATLRKITLFCGLLAVLFCLVLTNFYGILGCAVSIAFFTGFQNIIAFIMVKQKVGFYTIRL
jgi:O-antigen/teichoic acid export membrane protein